ncbi:hypothetical protein NO995_00745 [Aestuariibaculum sp. M13]|uniref:hypothetical protein n=1 Tax=Aestuariibaculum sp. M13 TaxID=2967132 RepID=UPI002159EF3D|nr:hypothetical protein [Aestuariibaculum sp. M13]MCR8666198.1 hypothetical protein [Aestuariibaculum sp. M13]
MRNLRIYFIVCLLCFTSCEKENNEVKFDQDYAIAFTGNTEWPLVANHKNGEHIGIKVNEQTNIIEGVTYVFQDLKVYLELTPEGIPISGYANDNILLFENYNGTSIDIGIITPNGETRIFRDLEIEQDQISQSKLSYSKNQISQSLLINSNNQDLSKALSAASVGIGIFACALSATSIIPSLGLTSSLALLTCGSALTSTLALIYDLDKDLDTGATGFGLYSNSIGCATAGIGGASGLVTGVSSCIGFFLDIATLIEDSYDNQLNKYNSEFNSTQASLIDGIGAASLKNYIKILNTEEYIHFNFKSAFRDEIANCNTSYDSNDYYVFQFAAIEGQNDSDSQIDIILVQQNEIIDGTYSTVKDTDPGIINTCNWYEVSFDIPSLIYNDRTDHILLPGVIDISSNKTLIKISGDLRKYDGTFVSKIEGQVVLE